MIETLSKTIGDTFNLLIKSFRLSSIFPALCFVLINVSLLMLYPFDQNLRSFLQGTDFLANPGLLVFIFILTALVSYILNYLNFPLIYLAEGYSFAGNWWFRFCRDWQMTYKKFLEQKSKDTSLPEFERMILEERLSDYFPPETERCAPTALGNVTAAFEAYPYRRYGIDAVYMWPRLVPILSKEEYAVFVEREKGGVDFFLNSFILCSILAFESIVLRFLLGNSLFTWIALISGTIAFFSYQATVRCAVNWGETIKTAFDLYRYPLAKQLALSPFTDKVDETLCWGDISDFIKGYRDFFRFSYPMPKEKQEKDE